MRSETQVVPFHIDITRVMAALFCLILAMFNTFT